MFCSNYNIMEKAYESLVVAEHQARPLRPNHLPLHTLILHSPTFSTDTPESLWEEWIAQNLYCILWPHCALSA